MNSASIKKIYLHGLISSLVNLILASIYSLFVIRLSLDYLGKDEFGLLSLISQVAIYISVIDLGIFAAFSRILIDYTTGTEERYANALKTATRIFNILGVIALFVTTIVAFTGGSVLSIPVHLHRDFIYLMLAQGFSIFFTFSLKPITAPLIANGKQHYIYWLNSGLVLVNTLIFWLALRHGIGLYSSLLANTVVLLITGLCLWRMAKPYLMRDRIRGIFDASIYKEISALARDSMLWQIGGHTMGVLPILLVSTWFTLGDTADLSGGMKLILLMVTVCTRFGDMSVTPLSIQYAKGNKFAAAAQMTRIAAVAGGIGACAALFIVCVNPAFISWWMLDKITWSWHENLSGALWIAILTVTQCLYGYAVVCRQMNLIRWAFLTECAIYVALAFAFRHLGGPASLLWAKPVATLLIGIAVARSISKNTQFDTIRLISVVLRQGLAITLMVPICLFLSRQIPKLSSDPLHILILSCLLSATSAFVAIPILFSKEIRADLQRTILEFMNRGKPILPQSEN